MKQAGFSKRSSRGRSFERPRSAQKNSNGHPCEPNTRSNPQQTVEKYLALARDATASGDIVSAENYYQYADHYYRLASAHRLSRISDKHRDKGEKPSPAATEGSPGEALPQEQENTLKEPS